MFFLLNGTRVDVTGERYDFVINAEQPVGAYWIQVRGLGECGRKRVQQLGILRYARGPYQPTSRPPSYDVGLPQGVVNIYFLVLLLLLLFFSLHLFNKHECTCTIFYDVFFGYSPLCRALLRNVVSKFTVLWKKECYMLNSYHALI